MWLIQKIIRNVNTIELHFSGINGTAKYPDKQEVRIIGFLFANRLHGQFDVENKFVQTAVLGYLFVYVPIK